MFYPILWSEARSTYLDIRLYELYHPACLVSPGMMVCDDLLKRFKLLEIWAWRWDLAIVWAIVFNSYALYLDTR